MEDKRQRLLKRLNPESPLIVAEGYLMELERRGYNKNGSFIPTAVVDHPDKVEELTREFVHAGSDVCEAFVYYAHKEKLRDIGRGEDFESLNRKAHEIAKKVALETGTLFCAGFGTTNIYDPNDPETIAKSEQLYREQIALSAEYDVDFVVIETIWDYGEASIALKVCNEFNIPAVVTLAPAGPETVPKTFDGLTLVDALQRLQSEGAVCVGVNCMRGPKTMIPIVRELRQHIKGPLACISTGYRTTEENRTWYKLSHPDTEERSFPDNICGHYIGNSDAEKYAQELKEIGVEYVGFCCGNAPCYTRTLAISYGRNPPAAKYTSDYKVKSSLGKTSYTSSRYGVELRRFMGIDD